ncbi:MAG TPA: protein-glutamate O-methyltransferase CheR [Acidothermaceae bacterium]
MKFSLTDEEFETLRGLLEKSAGLVHDESRRDSLSFAVAGRMEASGASSPAAYLAMLSGPGGAPERQQLIDVVTIQETHFFRNPPQIRALRQHVLPELIRRSTALNRPLTIWSAGCSTGEEPYSLAMLVRELMPMATREHVRIVGSDVSATALAFADAGRYGARAVQMADPIDLGRWFDIDHGSYSVKDDVRELVDLQLHNLITEAPPFESGEVDLLLCRNVTIYFNRTTTKALMSRFHTALGDGGYLFLGHSETLWQMSEAFTLVPLGDAFVYRRDDGPQGRATLPDRRTEAGDAPILLPERRGRTERRRDLPDTPSARIKTAPPVPPQRVPRHSEPARQEVARSASHRPADRRASPRSAAAASATGASAQELVATAREALAQGRYPDAVGAAGRAAKADPMLVDPHLIGGEALVNLGRDADAIRELRQAVYLQPDSASALLLLAGALDRQGEPAAAGRAYRSAAATVGDLPPEEVSAFFGGRSAAELVALCLRLATQAERTAKATKSVRFRTRETP